MYASDVILNPHSISMTSVNSGLIWNPRSMFSVLGALKALEYKALICEVLNSLVIPILGTKAFS